MAQRIRATVFHTQNLSMIYNFYKFFHFKHMYDTLYIFIFIDFVIKINSVNVFVLDFCGSETLCKIILELFFCC